MQRLRLCALLGAIGFGAAQAAIKPVDQGVAWDSDSAMAAGIKRSPRGAEIYRQTCVACHEHGLKRAPAVYLLRMTSPQRIYEAFTTGAMRVQGQSLSDADKRAVALFLSADHAETDSHLAPPTCQSDAARFDYRQPPAFPGWGMTLANTREVQQVCITLAVCGSNGTACSSDSRNVKNSLITNPLSVGGIWVRPRNCRCQFCMVRRPVERAQDNALGFTRIPFCAATSKVHF